MSNSAKPEMYENREANFTSFMNNEVNAFWQQRQEWHFSGVENLKLQGVKFTHPEHQKVIVFVTGIMDCYVRYAEFAYDLFHAGYDVMMFDNRGQGYSEHVLQSTKRVYVEKFSDYVDDLAIFWQDYILSAHYQQRYIIGHSMGGAIGALFLMRHPKGVNSAVLAAPMFDIHLPLPRRLVKQILKFTERRRKLRSAYAAYMRNHFPFKVNIRTHSQARYEYLLSYYRDDPAILMHGPTWHWLFEAISACKQIHKSVEDMTTPMLLIKAAKERIVCNKAIDDFHLALVRCGLQTETPWLTTDDEISLCHGDGLMTFHKSYHDIFIERDDTRNRALNTILDFFAHY